MLSIELIEETTPGIIEFDLKSMINLIIIPFSEISSQSTEKYIYTGEEKIPFKERHPVYQAVMLREFCSY